MNKAGLIVLCYMCWAGGANYVAADWSLNPFAAKADKGPLKKPITSKSSKRKTLESAPAGGQKLVKVPGFVTNMGSSTKKMFSSSVNVLTPKKKPEPRSKYNRPVSHSPSKRGKKGEKPSGMKSWFAKQEPEPPKSVMEWMALPRNDL